MTFLDDLCFCGHARREHRLWLPVQGCIACRCPDYVPKVDDDVAAERVRWQTMKCYQPELQHWLDEGWEPYAVVFGLVAVPEGPLRREIHYLKRPRP